MESGAFKTCWQKVWFGYLSNKIRKRDDTFVHPVFSIKIYHCQRHRQGGKGGTASARANWGEGAMPPPQKKACRKIIREYVVE